MCAINVKYQYTQRNKTQLKKNLGWVMLKDNLLDVPATFSIAIQKKTNRHFALRKIGKVLSSSLTRKWSWWDYRLVHIQLRKQNLTQENKQKVLSRALAMDFNWWVQTSWTSRNNKNSEPGTLSPLNNHRLNWKISKNSWIHDVIVSQINNNCLQI